MFQLPLPFFGNKKLLRQIKVQLEDIERLMRSMERERKKATTKIFERLGKLDTLDRLDKSNKKSPRSDNGDDSENSENSENSDHIWSNLLSEIRTLLADVSATNARYDKTLSGLLAATNKHDMAIADLIDSWEEIQDHQEKDSKQLQSLLSGEYQKEIQNLTQREQSLLRLMMSYHDQLYVLRRAAAQSEDAVWSHQLDMLEQKLAHLRTLTAIEVICDPGSPVNYDLHEVLEAVPTEDEDKALHVAEVYTCGYVYHGRVLRKASITAYQLSAKVA